MKDVTTEWPDIDESRPETASQTRLGRLSNSQNAARYVPMDVTCAECGRDGEEFRWFQRVAAGDVDDGVPATDLHFCSIVCLGLWSGQFDAYDPETLPVGVR